MNNSQNCIGAALRITGESWHGADLKMETGSEDHDTLGLRDGHGCFEALYNLSLSLSTQLEFELGSSEPVTEAASRFRFRAATDEDG